MGVVQVAQRDLHLLSAENQTLLYGRDALLLFDLLLDVGDLYVVFESVGYSGTSLAIHPPVLLSLSLSFSHVVAVTVDRS